MFAGLFMKKLFVYYLGLFFLLSINTFFPANINPKYLIGSSYENNPDALKITDEYLSIAMQYPLIIGVMALESGIIKNILLYTPKNSAVKKVADLLFHLKAGIVTLSDQLGKKINNMELLGKFVRKVFLEKEINQENLKPLLDTIIPDEPENPDNQKHREKTIGYKKELIDNIITSTNEPWQFVAISYLILGLVAKKAFRKADVQAFCNGLYVKGATNTIEKKTYTLEELEKKGDKLLDPNIDTEKEPAITFEEAAIFNDMNHRETRLFPVILEFTTIPATGDSDGQHFSDCVENTVHNIIRLLSFDYSENTPNFSEDLLKARININEKTKTPNEIINFLKNHPNDKAREASSDEEFKKKYEQTIHSEWNTALKNATSQTKFLMYSSILDNKGFQYGNSYIYIPKDEQIPEKIEIEGFVFTPIHDTEKNPRVVEITSFVNNFFILLESVLGIDLLTNQKEQTTIEDLTKNSDGTRTRKIKRLNELLKGVEFSYNTIEEKGKQIEVLEMKIWPAQANNVNEKKVEILLEEQPLIFEIKSTKHEHTEIVLQQKQEAEIQKKAKPCLLPKGITGIKKNILRLLCKKSPNLETNKLNPMMFSNKIIEKKIDLLEFFKKSTIYQGLLQNFLSEISIDSQVEADKLFDHLSSLKQEKDKTIYKNAKDQLTKTMNSTPIRKRKKPFFFLANRKENDFKNLGRDIFVESFNLKNTTNSLEGLFDLLQELEPGKYTFLFSRKKQILDYLTQNQRAFKSASAKDLLLATHKHLQLQEFEIASSLLEKLHGLIDPAPALHANLTTFKNFWEADKSSQNENIYTEIAQKISQKKPLLAKELKQIGVNENLIKQLVEITKKTYNPLEIARQIASITKKTIILIGVIDAIKANMLKKINDSLKKQDDDEDEDDASPTFIF